MGVSAVSEGVCFAAGCGALDCGHLRWLDDGLGNWAEQCRPGCDLQVVRPGHFACSCDDEGCTGDGRGKGGPCPCQSCTPQTLLAMGTESPDH